MSDADFDLVVNQLINEAYGSTGERYMAATVVVAVGDIADVLIEKLVQAANDITMGSGINEGVFLGSVIRESHKVKTVQYIESGQKEGAVLIRNRRKDAGRSNKVFLSILLFSVM
jgi:malonate-semialdehyde dehydrogenase (acetylating) / methylmalonate-semialdehyde dehydrogenase